MLHDLEPSGSADLRLVDLLGLLLVLALDGADLAAKQRRARPAREDRRRHWPVERDRLVGQNGPAAQIHRVHGKRRAIIVLPRTV